MSSSSLFFKAAKIGLIAGSLSLLMAQTAFAHFSFRVAGPSVHMRGPAASFRAPPTYRFQTRNAGRVTARNYRGDLPKGANKGTQTTGNGISVVKTTVELGRRNWPRGIGSTIQNGASLLGINAGNRGSVIFRIYRPIRVGNGSSVVAAGSASSSVAGSSPGGSPGSGCTYNNTVNSLEAVVIADVNAIVAALQPANGGPASASLQALISQLENDWDALSLMASVNDNDPNFVWGIITLELPIVNQVIAAAQPNGAPSSASLQVSIEQLQNDASVLSSLFSQFGC